MAVLYITEFASLYSTAYSSAVGQLAAGAPLASQTVAIGAGSVQSAAFNAATTYIRVHTDVIASIMLGSANPVASATTMRMAANQTEYFGVRPGDKIAVISNV